MKHKTSGVVWHADLSETLQITMLQNRYQSTRHFDYNGLLEITDTRIVRCYFRAQLSRGPRWGASQFTQRSPDPKLAAEGQVSK